MATNKSAGERRANISPSDLTFSWDGCHRCLWLYYNHQIKAPMFMPTVAELADMQETYFKGCTTADMHPDMPEGTVHSHAGWVQSIPIQVDGKDSHLAIRGKYDLLIEFPDGTYGIVDCKMQARTSDKSAFYSPQLEAYAYALENPAKGEPKRLVRSEFIPGHLIKHGAMSEQDLDIAFTLIGIPSSVIRSHSKIALSNL